jgi:hypothetical protein
LKQSIYNLTTIRKKQLQLFEKLTMFEQRILCHKLPKSLDAIKPDIDQEQCVNKHNKMIQELEQYKMKIQHYMNVYINNI